VAAFDGCCSVDSVVAMQVCGVDSDVSDSESLRVSLGSSI